MEDGGCNPQEHRKHISRLASTDKKAPIENFAKSHIQKSYI